MNSFRENIERLIKNGSIVINKHPEKELYVLNYSRDIQFSRNWCEYTLMARGLVVDKDFNIVARGFNKFFNIEEHDPSEIPNLSFEVFEKMDGSYISLFYYEGEWIVASKGSFVSEQAIKAKEMLKYVVFPLNQNYTYVFEILYSENRIVVDYGDREELVLLAAIETKTNKEMPFDELRKNYSDIFTIVPRYAGFNDLSKLRQIEKPNMEGYVIKFSNGFRIKVKFEEYVRLHSILTNTSNLEVWRALRWGHSLDIQNIPDEFDEWIKKTKSELMVAYGEVHYQINKEFADVAKEVGLEFPYNKRNGINKKDFAIASRKKKMNKFIMAKFNKKDYNDKVWEWVRPVFSLPFMKDEEG